MSAPNPPTQGDIFILPPRITYLNDPKHRRHALLETHSFDSTASLVYASSSDELKTSGAVCHLVRPNGGNRLRTDTYFYGSVLISVPDHHLTDLHGNIASEMAAVRGVVRRAMGYRTGPGYNRPIAQPSLRGRVIQVTTEYEQLIGTCYFVVLTEHDYSMKRQHQIVLPLFDAEEWDADGGDLISIDTTAAMRNVLGDRVKRVLTAGLLTHSIWHRSTVHSETRCSLDQQHLEAIEDDICSSLAV